MRVTSCFLVRVPFERSSNKGLLAHHERLQKMLEATKRRREISEARKADREDPPKKEEDEDDGLQVKGTH